LLTPAHTAIFRSLLLVGSVFLVLGWYDDRHHVPPPVRLLISTALFGGAILIQPELALTSLDFGWIVLPLGVLIFPFTVLCLVGLQNAINMADGMNGLLIGLAIFWTICLLLYAPADLLLYLAFMLLGLVILLLYNVAGALFLGDAGSYAIGGTVGVMMIYSHHRAGGALPMLTVVLWLLVPVVDCVRVMMMRLAHGRSPLQADKNHLHHRLSQRWRWPVCLALYLALVVIPGATGALWPSLSFAMIVLTLMCYGSILMFTQAPRIGPPVGPRAGSD
jgi:UDP-GlcNAc:undecaprenyl-phosphate GlcNAc-1-phosphate transferase